MSKKELLGRGFSVLSMKGYGVSLGATRKLGFSAKEVESNYTHKEIIGVYGSVPTPKFHK